MITWIASYPRSGNTLLRVILSYGFGLPCPPRYPRQAHVPPPRRAAPPLRLAGENRPRGLEAMQASPDTWYVKSHELPSDDRPALYLVRDGRDALVSYAHFILETADPSGRGRSLAEVLTQLVLRDRYFGGWGPHVDAWSGRRAPTALLKFEQLVTAPDPRPLVADALAKIGVSDPGPGDGEIPDFAALQRAQPRNFRRGQIGAWRREMPTSLAWAFWKRHGPVMERMGYER